VGEKELQVRALGRREEERLVFVVQDDEDDGMAGMQGAPLEGAWNLGLRVGRMGEGGGKKKMNQGGEKKEVLKNTT
jgi:hypothetical protein